MWIDVMQSNGDYFIFVFSAPSFHKSMRFYSLWDFVGSLNLTCSIGIDCNCVYWRTLFAMDENRFSSFSCSLLLSLSPLDSLRIICSFRFFLFLLTILPLLFTKYGQNDKRSEKSNESKSRMRLVSFGFAIRNTLLFFTFDRSIDSFVVKWEPLFSRYFAGTQQLATHISLLLVYVCVCNVRAIIVINAIWSSSPAVKTRCLRVKLCAK